MAQRATVRTHARYVPCPPRPRPLPRSHATPLDRGPTARVGPPQRTRARTRPRGRAVRGPLCALLLTLGGLLLGLGVLAHGLVPRAGNPGTFPLLVVGTLTILLRGQGSVERYRGLRQRAGLGDQRGDTILALLYILVFLAGVAVVAMLVSLGANALIGLLGRWW